MTKTRTLTFEQKQTWKPRKKNDEEPKFKQIETAKMYRDIWHNRG